MKFTATKSVRRRIDGNSITSTSYLYQVTNSSTAPSADNPSSGSLWVTLAEAMIPYGENYPYLWRRQQIDYTDMNPDIEVQLLSYFEKGDDGVSVDDIDDEYAVNNSDTTAPSSGWDTFDNVKSSIGPNNRYLWNREKVKYSDSSTYKTLDAHIIYNYAEDGEDGRGIEEVNEYYAYGSSSAPVSPADYDDPDWDTNWGTTELTPSATTGQSHVWQVEEIVYTNSTSELLTAHIIAMYIKGADGRSVLGTTDLYAVNNSDSTPPTLPSTSSGDANWGSFDDVKSQLDSSHRYLWNVEFIHYSNDTESRCDAHLVFRLTTDGSDGISYWLEKTATIISKDTNNANTLTPSSVTVYSKKNVGGTTSDFTSGTIKLYADGTEISPTSSTTSSITFNTSASVSTYTIKLFSSNIELDTETIPVISTGQSAVVAVLTNDSAQVPADEDGVVSSFASATTVIEVYEGSTKVTPTSYIQTPSTGCTLDQTTISTATCNVTGMTTDSASVTITATYGGVTYSKVFTITKQKQGIEGVGISSIVEYYAYGTYDDPVSQPNEQDGHWGTTPINPVAEAGKYFVWQSEKVIKSDNTSSFTAPHRLAGSAIDLVIQYCYGNAENPENTDYVIGYTTYIMGMTGIVIGPIPTTNIWKDESLPHIDGLYIWMREGRTKGGEEWPTSWVYTRLTGDTGAEGTSVTVSSIEYGVSASQSTAPSSYSTTYPTLQQGDWLWTKTSYSDGNVAITKTLIGTDGDPADLADIYLSSQTYVMDLRKSTSTDIIVSVQLQGAYTSANLAIYDKTGSTPTGLAYITKIGDTPVTPCSNVDVQDEYKVTVSIPKNISFNVSFVLTYGTNKSVEYICAPKDETEYGHNFGLLDCQPILFSEDTSNGIDIGGGYYFHFAWANSADGSSDFSTTTSSQKPYYGTLKDTTQADSTTYSDYTWQNYIKPIYAEGKPKDFYTLRTDANTYELCSSGWVLATGISSLLVGLDDCINSENPVDLNEHNDANGVTKLRTLITQEVISYLIKAFRVEVGEAELPASAQVGDPYLFVRIADNRAMQGYNETYSPPEFFVQSIKKTSSGSDKEILFSINPTTGYVTMKNASLDGDDSSFKSSTFKTSKASGGEKTLNGSYSSLTYYYCLESNELDHSFAEDLWDYVCTNGTTASASDVLVYNIPTGCKKIAKGGYYNGTSIGCVFANPDIPRGIGYHVRGTIKSSSGSSTALFLSYESGATLNVAETVTSAIQDVNISSSDYKVGYLMTSAFISGLNAPKGFSMKIKSGTAYTEDSDISASTPVYTKSFTTNDYVLVTDTAIQFTNGDSSTLLQVGDLVQRFDISSVTVHSSLDGIATKNIIPMDYDATNKFSIGTSTEPFGDIWGTNVYGAVFN